MTYRFHAVLMVFVLSIGTSVLYADDVQPKAHSKNPKTQMSPGQTLEVPQIDDSNLQRVVRKILRNLDYLVDGSVVNVRRFFHLIQELFRILGQYLGLIDQQIQSSECHNRSCSDYGTKD